MQSTEQLALKPKKGVCFHKCHLASKYFSAHPSSGLHLLLFVKVSSWCLFRVFSSHSLALHQISLPNISQTRTWVVLSTLFGLGSSCVLSLMYTSSPLPQSWFPPLRTVFLLPPKKRNLLSVCTWFSSGCFQWKSPLTAHRGHQYEVGGCRERVKMAQCYNLFRHWTGPGLKYSK